MILHNGDCLTVLKTLPDNSVDSIVTDPPYGLKFMGKKWDYDVPSVEIWKECLRVLKPGGHALIACGTRTQHRMAVNVEDAGFEVRDVITWLYGSGFPKSLDVSKAIDKSAGAEREIVGLKPDPRYLSPRKNSPNHMDRERGADGGHGVDSKAAQLTAPSTDAAKQWQGWGTALKPACEFWTLARKPLSEKTVAENVQAHRTGALNIDGCRVEATDQDALAKNWDRVKQKNLSGVGTAAGEGVNSGIKNTYTAPTQGRWPANVILDEEAGRLLDEQSGHLVSKWGTQTKTGRVKNDLFGTGVSIEKLEEVNKFQGDSGGASRFFYCAKASKSERNAGLEGMPQQDTYSEASATPMRDHRAQALRANHHPTVKPIKLMRYLCKLITPPGGTVLDPFMGSGSTGVAAKQEWFGFIGCELDSDYFEIAKTRCKTVDC